MCLVPTYPVQALLEKSLLYQKWTSASLALRGRICTQIKAHELLGLPNFQNLYCTEIRRFFIKV